MIEYWAAVVILADMFGLALVATAGGRAVRDLRRRVNELADQKDGTARRETASIPAVTRDHPVTHPATEPTHAIPALPISVHRTDTADMRQVTADAIPATDELDVPWVPSRRTVRADVLTRRLRAERGGG